MMASVFYTLEREVINEKKLMKDIIRLVSAQIFQKLTFLTPLIYTHACAYQWVRNDSFLEKSAYVLNGWLKTIHKTLVT